MVRGSPNPLYFGLPARLRKVRKQAGLTRAALGYKVSRDSEVTADIEAGERIPTVGMLARLATVLRISPGWLGFGIGEPHSEGLSATTDGMRDRVQSVRLERQLTKAALARQAAISPGTLADIESGAQTGVDVLEALAKALGVSPAWLAYGEGPQLLPPRRRTRTTIETSAKTSTLLDASGPHSQLDPESLR